MDTSLNVNDKVRLNSGSPDLTVVCVDHKNNQVVVTWFADELEELSLPINCVRRVEIGRVQ